ncbi:hypothetical protein G9A89_016996 [Geosiphon pyriformis]|nr:hypothetical protein G9A89_016996 [Geosiphon pyriformis]
MELAILLISPATNKHQQHLRKETKTSDNICKNNFKVVTTSDTTTLEYYQSIYTHCKQRFNIPDGIEVVKKSVYQYIENCINNYLFGNYNISEVRSNLYNNLAHYLQLGTEDLNSETLATYFHELNFNIIKYCEETYPVQSQYTIDFESKTETSNKSKNKLKQYSRTTPNTPTLPKTTAKHLQTPEQGTSSKLPLTITPFPASLVQAQTPNSPLNQFARSEDFTSLRSPTRQQESLQTSSNLLDFLAENQSKHSETAANKENNSEITEEESIDSENKEGEMTTYITKISEFNGKNIETITKAGDANGWNATRMLKTIPYFLKETAREWFENLAALFNDWNAFKAVFLEQFTDNNTSITLRNHFRNIKQEPSESVMTYIGKFNKLLRWIRQLETNNYYSDAQILDQFIAGLKDKLIKKVCPHTPEDLNSAIQHAKRYKMAMKEANCTKLVNLAIGETSSAAKEKIDQLTKKVKNYFTNQQQQQPQRYQPPQRRNQNNFALLSNNQPQNCHYSRISGHWKRDSRPTTNPTAIPTTTHTTLSSICLKTDYTKSIHITKPIPSKQQLNHYHTQPSYLTMPEEQDFHHTALSESRAAAQQQQNSSHNHTTIPPAQIAENANLSDIFPFEFEANESPFLLSNAAANEQKAITAMYTEAEVEGKPIHLILDSGSAGSIITYQLMQQLKRNVDRLAQTVIITADGIKKTPVGEIDNFLFTLDGITIPVKVLVMDAPQYQALLTISYQGQHAQVPVIYGTFNKRSEKALAFEFEPEEEKPIIETFMAFGSTSNWANKTEQEHFTSHTKPETSGWNIPYLKPEPKKRRPYIPLKYKDCHKKLLLMGACISPKEEYENHTCYYYKACHRESGKWDNTPCLTCGNMLPEECNWIDVTMRGGVCNQICQYVLSISEKVKRGTPFNAAYNSALNKLYYYSHDAEIIFDLAMALINGATKEDVHQMKEAEYIEYTMELAGFDYKDEVEQINIRLCEECIMPCDEQWCPECYALSIPLPSENDENEIEFGDSEETEETEKTKVATKTLNLTVLEFCHAIYTQNQSDLGLPEGCCPAESALTYYINARINYHIGKEEEPHNAKLGLYRKLSQYTTKEVAVIAATIVKIHRKIEQYANENFPISTGNTRECANKTKENLETNQESNQQKLGTPAQMPKKTVTQSIKKQRIYSPEDKSYHFSPENKIQIPLGAASSSTSTPQMPRTPSYIDKIKQRNWGDIPITGGYSSLFQNPLFQPKFRTGFENHEEKSESESEKETSEKTITRPVTGTSSQSRNQETCDQEEEPDIREATFRNAQGNIISPSLRPINPPAENGNEMTTSYIARLTNFSGEEEEMDVHTWLREAQKAIQANNWNDQRAIQILPFFLKGTADSWYQSLKTKLTSFAEFKNALLEYFSDPNAVIQLQNKFNTIKQNTGETVIQYLAQFNQIRRQIEVIEQEYYTDPQVLNQFIRGLKSSILGRVRPAHPNSLPEAVTLARALESAKKEANHSQMVNIVIEENKTETLEKRVTQLGKELSKKIESYLIPDPRKNTYQPPQKHSQEVSDSRNNRSLHQEFRTETRACHFCKRVRHLISQCQTRMMQEARENNYYAPPQMPRNQYTPIPRQYPTTYQNQGAYQQQPMIANPNWHPEARNQPMWNQNALVQRNPNHAGTNQQTNPNYQNYQQTYLNIPENLIIGNNDDRNINRTKNFSKLSQTIPPAVATEDSSLTAIFPFELKENEAMFSEAALDEKRPITAMYMEATVNNTPIKLILDSRFAGSIVTLQLVNQLGFKVDRAATFQIITANGSTKLPHGEIDSFPFEINGIAIPTKVLVMDTT